MCTSCIPADPCTYRPTGCPEGFFRVSRDSGCCQPGSPILIDVTGNGLDLTNAANGVVFNLSGDESRRFAWTLAGSDDAWLALDGFARKVVLA